MGRMGRRATDGKLRIVCWGFKVELPEDVSGEFGGEGYWGSIVGESEVWLANVVLKRIYVRRHA